MENRDRREAGLLLPFSPPALPCRKPWPSIAPVAERWVKENPRSTPTTTFGFNWPGAVGGSPNEAIIFLQLGWPRPFSPWPAPTSRICKWPRRVAPPGPGYPLPLGANRWMLDQAALTESLSCLRRRGLRLLIAGWSNDLIGRNIRLGLPPPGQPIDGRVLGFHRSISILAGLGFGLIPAWLASRPSVNEALKQQARGSTGAKARVGFAASSSSVRSRSPSPCCRSRDDDSRLNRTINSRPIGTAIHSHANVQDR